MLPQKPNTRGQAKAENEAPKIEIEPTLPRAVSLESFTRGLLAGRWHEDILNSKPAEWRNRNEGQRSFRSTFQDSKVYFNHFIKIDDPRVIHRDSLWRLIAQGAAVMCANGQGGVDLVIPFVYHTEKLGRNNVSAIFIQVKNNAKFGTIFCLIP